MDVGNFYCILMSKYLKILAGTTIYFSTTSKTVVKYRNSRISTDADWTTKLSISELTPKQEFWKDRCIYPAKKPVNRIDANLGKYIFYSLKIAVHKKNNRTFFVLHLPTFGNFKNSGKQKSRAFGVLQTHGK